MAIRDLPQGGTGPLRGKRPVHLWLLSCLLTGFQRGLLGHLNGGMPEDRQWESVRKNGCRGAPPGKSETELQWEGLGWLSWEKGQWGPKKSPGVAKEAGAWYVLCQWTRGCGILMTIYSGIDKWNMFWDFVYGLCGLCFGNKVAPRYGGKKAVV